MDDRQSLTDFIAVFDPASDAIGAAEFEARLAALLGVVHGMLDDALAALPPARIAHLLHAPDDAARRLRVRLRILERRVTEEALAEALARVAVEGARPAAALLAAFGARASREPIDEAERLVAEIRDAREDVLALWPEAFDAVARWGTIDQRAAWSIGIGSVVYGMLAQALGRTTEDRIGRDEFVAMCPRLVEFWPLTPASHEAMHALLAIVRAAASGEIRTPAARLEAVN